MIIGLNCGSGQRPFFSTPEVKWLNVDSQVRWQIDILCDAANLPVDPESIDYFVLHHVLEHFGCGEAGALITEAHRVLKPGGSLLIFVPDMRALAERWLQGGLSTQIYLTNVYGAYMGHEDDRHKWGFDRDHLREFLTVNAKWEEIAAFNWRTIPGGNFARDFWIIGMEAVK